MYKQCAFSFISLLKLLAKMLKENLNKIILQNL